MKYPNAILLLVGCMTSISISQQIPPPPPPQSQVPATSGQTGNQGNTPQQSNPQQQSPTTQPSAPPAAQQPEPPATSPQEIQKPKIIAPILTPQKPTEPNVPAPRQESGAQQPNELPQSDKEELERIQSEMDRIEAKRQIIEIRKKDDERLRESRAVLKELLSGKVKAANSLLEQSKCVIVIPSVKKAATVFGVKYGRGVMSCRLGEDFRGPWSPPSMYALEGGNFGLQIGLQATDLVLMVMNDRGVDSLLGSKAKLGGDMSVAAGPVGRTAEASTDLAMRAKILAYSRAHGIFAGISLDGSTLRPDDHANEALYGRTISARTIVRQGEVRVPHDAVPLIRLLDESAPVASDSK